MTTLNAPPFTRFVLRGLSDGAQPADGVPELAATAYQNLLASTWNASADAPSMPVHDNGQQANRDAPTGDAFKCCYGYDAESRTERSAAGAACYTVAIPAGALTGEACSITSITGRIIGDRYLDAGVRVRALASDSPIPPPISDFLSAATATEPLCATSDQTYTDREGATQTLAPNNRIGEREDFTLTLTLAAARYLHICLALVDYTTNRGAWIEGGAMFAPAALSIEFSRDIGDAPAAAVAAPLTLGQFDTSQRNAQSGPSSRRQDVYTLSLSETLLSTLDDGGTSTDRARHILTAALQGSNPLLGTCAIVQHSSAAYGIGATTLAAAVISRSGLVPAGFWQGIRAELPFRSPCDARLLIYAIRGSTAMLTAAVDGAPATTTASICLDWASVIRREAFLSTEPSGSMQRLCSGLSSGAFSTISDVRQPIVFDFLGSVLLQRDSIYSTLPFSSILKTVGATPDLVTILAHFIPIGHGGGVESVQTTTRVLDTLAYSHSDSFSRLDFDHADGSTEEVWNYLYGPTFRISYSAYSATHGTGSSASELSVTTNGCTIKSVVTHYSTAQQSETLNDVIAYPSGTFQIGTRTLHYDAGVMPYDLSSFSLDGSPRYTSLTEIYNETNSTWKTITWTIPPLQWGSASVPVYEIGSGGARIARGTATLRVRFNGGTISEDGWLTALGFLNEPYVEINGAGAGSGGSLVNSITFSRSIEYYHEITEETSAYSASETFELPEISLIPATASSE